jgi:hypothetical protein
MTTVPPRTRQLGCSIQAIIHLGARRRGRLGALYEYEDALASTGE